MSPTAEAFSHLQLYPVLDSLPSGVTLVNTDGKIVFSNQAADDILGVEAAAENSADEWGDHYGVFLPDGETPFPADQYPLVRALKGERTQDVEMIVRNPRRPEGAIVSVSGQQLVDADGALIGAAAVFRDVSQLRKVERLKDDLAAFIVHDLKGPLTTIIATCDLMQLDHQDEDLIQDLETVRRAAQTVNRMVMDLLDVQMSDAGALEPSRERLALAELLEDVEAAAKAQVGKKLAHRIVAGDPGELTVDVDRDLIFRVLMNLIDNCLKYGPQEGKIWIDAEPNDDDTVLLTIQDEGPGVPVNLRERIFEKYAMVEREAHYRARESRGLGLRFCKVAVEAHGGRIWVEDGEPKGARFCVELPLGE